MKTNMFPIPSMPSFHVYILPLRNENKIVELLEVRAIHSLYPTFKEWKQIIEKEWCMWYSCLYPTFKEWKRRFHPATSRVPNSLYPTFKEWKRQQSRIVKIIDGMFISYL